MFLLHTKSGDLIRIENLEELFSPWSFQVCGRDQAGEEEQDKALYPKDELVFPSGEPLPRCWTERDYRCASKTLSAHR